MPVYEGYATPEEFHLGYDNFITPEVVAHWDAIFRADSERVLADFPQRRELRYGPKERNAIDFFPASNISGPAPVLVAIHGGLWFLFDKWVMHFLVPAFTRAGVHVACPNYGLAPRQGLGDIVRDARAAADFLHREAGDLKIDPARISVLGHSAAGQIAALVASPTETAREAGAAPSLHALIGVSGFYDIEPFALTEFHRSTRFSADDYVRWNPLRHAVPDFPPTLLFTGARESSLLQQMTRHFAAALREQGVSVETDCAEGECHFSVLHALGDPMSPLFQRVLAAVK